MARNGDLRGLLEKTLDVRRARLYNIAADVADSLSISTADAILVLAAKNRINLHKYGGNLSSEKLDEIRRLAPQLLATFRNVAPVVPTSNGKRKSPKLKKAFKVKLENPEDDPILSTTTRN